MINIKKLKKKLFKTQKKKNDSLNIRRLNLQREI